MEAHFGSYAYDYGVDADNQETKASLRHRFERMVAVQSGRILPWEDFDVVRRSRKPSSLLELTSAHAVVRSTSVSMTPSFL